MNKERRARLSEVVEDLEEIYCILEEIKDEEEEAFCNLPESLQQSERGQNMEDAVSEIDSAMDAIDSVCVDINDIVENY